MAEAVALLEDLGASAAPGGPLSEQPGTFWIALPDDDSTLIDAAASRLPRLGYTESVTLLEPVRGNASFDVRWRGNNYDLTPLYEEDPEDARSQAPDQRVFLLATGDGDARPVRGYRGDGQALSRRGLPVYDARLLVNLTGVREGESLLDPFAGIGGILLAAKAATRRVYSLDVDPALRFGLAAMSAAHLVGDARRLPYRDQAFDAIATEPPYDAEALPAVVSALGEMTRVLRTGRRLTLLCTVEQAPALREAAARLPLDALLDEPVDRKGLPCVLLAWRRT